MAEKKNKAAGAWYSTGKAGWKKAKEEDAAAKARREQRGPRRFWLDYDKSAKIVFLDTPDFFVHEHNLKIGGKYFNYATCLREVDTCPPCDEGDNPSYIVAGSIINLTPWTDKEGKVHKNEKQLFVAKGRARQRLMKQIERRGGDLTGCVYEMSRGSSTTECSTGEDFEYIKTVEVKKMLKAAPVDKKGQVDKTFIEPFNYAEIFAPKTSAELREMLGLSAPVGSEEEAGEEPEKPDWDDLEDMSKKELKKVIKAFSLDADPDDIDDVDDLREAVAKELGVKKSKKKKAKEPEPDDDDDDNGEEAEEPKKGKKEKAKGKKKKEPEPEDDDDNDSGDDDLDDLL
jgi:hypothetical protein